MMSAPPPPPLASDIIIIDSDSEYNARDLDRKPAAKSTPPCISLLDSDDENHPNGRVRNNGRKRPRLTLSSKAEADDRQLAEDIQGQENLRNENDTTKECSADLELAEELQRQENLAAKRARKKARQEKARKEKADREMAMELALAEELQRRGDLASKRASDDAMKNSSDGKAVLAVQEIIALVKSAKGIYVDGNSDLKGHSVEAVTIDDMVFFAKNMLDLQQEYIQKHLDEGKDRDETPGHIDVGYHYTDNKNMADIRTHGLLTKSDRKVQKVQAVPKGSVFGDGIYTANNGNCFKHFGDTGLIVGRLKGKMVRAVRFLPPNQAADANTIIGDKLTGVAAGKQAHADGWPVDDSYHEFVLKSSAQCLPMVKFDRAMREHRDGKECIRYIKKELKGILNRLFNRGLKPIDILRAPLINAASVSTTGHSTSVGAARGALNPPMPLLLPTVAALGLHNLANAPAWSLSFAANAVASSLPATQAHGNSTATLQGAQNAATTAAPAFSSSNFTSMLPNFGVSAQLGRSMPFPNPGPARSLVNATTNAHSKRSFAANQTKSLEYIAPQNLITGVPTNALIAPSTSCNMNDTCVICHDRLKKRRLCAALDACKHIFHKKCIQLALKSKPQCPLCRVPLGDPQGKSPSGKMVVCISQIRCSGFRENSIVIDYQMPSGRQLGYHGNPGRRYAGKHAVAYLPDNSDGQDLLKRLKYAFLHGLTFTVGTSITTGLADQCTWSSVHHKTHPSGGAGVHGFPDPDYFRNCNGELDSLGVPCAKDLDDDGRIK